DNDPAWVTSSVWGSAGQASLPDAVSATFALEGAQVTTRHGEELIGWVAIETGSGVIDGRAYSTGMGALSAGNSGHDNGCFSVDSFAFSHAPQVIATQVGMAGGNGSWSRLCGAGITQNAIFVHSDEDQVATEERAHMSE